ncbi:hypothetical protein RM863_33090 [Streptomyces sp. DSM 41014]|uniref:Uncharacterized protein n=1 Tax=Streptomyces hintoniae TaxID=3075521 RepID=A0ABU2UVY2_9ACTN|nr:hypothetical protein [Streptomyces sp. DSM 41014]MDT0476967.1 hypothetical protein [Streptomyces sp. DSM 41014]
MPSPSQPPTDGRRPRAMVIDSAWRGLGPGPESLSGPGGAPLTRTVKLIVLPLIVRPALRPELATDFLGPREAAQLDALIRESGPILDATARWFTLLKKTRRALGIVAGNPQDLYFQRCFELATEHGVPSEGADAVAVAREVLEDVADVTGGRTVEALREWLSDPERRERLDTELAAGWGRRARLPGAGTGGGAGVAGVDRVAGVAGVDQVAGVAEVGSAALREAVLAAGQVLESCGGRGSGTGAGAGARSEAGTGSASGRGSKADAGVFASMIESGHGSLLGRMLWAGGGETAVESAGAGEGKGGSEGADAGGSEGAGQGPVWGRRDIPAHLGLSAFDVPPRPEVGRGASTATLPAPLDRTLFERLFTVLQASTHREELPTVPELVRHEVGRSCAPLGLRDESLRVAVVLGGTLAVGLDPLGGGATGVGLDPLDGGAFAPGGTAAHRVVNSSWQREASVLRARRMTVSPRPDPDGGVLEALAHDLRTPWTAYMRRLWVRLHGRDVRDAPLTDTASAWAVLDGVARSVMMDHRARVRTALRTLATTPPPAAERRSA